MNKIIEKMQIAKIKVDVALRNLMKEERGDFGVKQIAMVVAVIIVIGFVIAALKTIMPDVVDDVWEFLFNQIKGIGGGGE